MVYRGNVRIKRARKIWILFKSVPTLHTSLALCRCVRERERTTRTNTVFQGLWEQGKRKKMQPGGGKNGQFLFTLSVLPLAALPQTPSNARIILEPGSPLSAPALGVGGDGGVGVFVFIAGLPCLFEIEFFFPFSAGVSSNSS